VLFYTSSPALYHISFQKHSIKNYIFWSAFLARSNNTHLVKNLKISQGVQKKLKQFPLFLALFNIFVTDMGKRDGLDNKHIVDDKLYSTNHLNSTKVSWYFQKILSLAQVVKYSTYLHISSKNDRNDIVNCDNCPPTFNKNNHQVP